MAIFSYIIFFNIITKNEKNIFCLFITCLNFLYFCVFKNENNLAGYSEEIKQAIRDLVNEYKDKNDAYLVSDFDNTTSIFDIAYQCSIYQMRQCHLLYQKMK